MNHNKYAVSRFLDIIFEEFSKSQPGLIINERFFHTDETAQHFKQKYSLFTMTLIDGNVWDFSATCHGKGDIDGLGGTCQHRVYEKTLARTTDLQNSIKFSKCAAAVWPRITILNCSSTDVEETKAAYDSSWHTNNGTVYSIPRKTHYFRNVNHNGNHRNPHRNPLCLITNKDSEYMLNTIINVI